MSRTLRSTASSRRWLSTAALLLLVGCASAPATPSATSEGQAGSGQTDVPRIPVERYTLPNGLTVLLSPDRSAPIVAVDVWYHVGSKNEKPGRTGFAHLFEHLMFNGSENFNDDFFKALDKVGATGSNGTTDVDRTNYFENAPKNALDFLLWLESDRMGHFAG